MMTEGKVKDRKLQEKEVDLLCYKAKEQRQAKETDQLIFAHSCEVEQLQLQLRDLSAQSQLLQSENEATIMELKTKVKLHDENEGVLTQERNELETHLTKERDLHRKDKDDLSSELLKLKSKVSSLQLNILTLEAEIGKKDIELAAKTRALERKDAIISEMNKQLTKVQEYVASKYPVS